MLFGDGEPGPRGPAGQRGPAGPDGPAGEADVDDEQVFSALGNDPQRVADLVSDLVGENLEPTPSDLQDSIDTVSDDLSTLCSDLSFADALSSEVISCP
jgi:hypothetical protein